MLITCLTHRAAAKLSIHDIRCVSAVWNTENGRFHPDAREHLHMSRTGKLITNLFSANRATVTAPDGTTTTVNARNAERGAAAVAIREIRATGTVTQKWTVAMTSRTGNKTAATEIFFGTDCGVTQDDTAGFERSEVQTVKMSREAVYSLAAEKFAVKSEDWQAANWERHLASVGTGA